MKRLEHYFPATRERHIERAGSGFASRPELMGDSSVKHCNGLSTKWRTILSLEMQGTPKGQIASMLGMSPTAVSNITLSEKYVKARDAYLETIDHEFLAMKPLAFKALENGLRSADEDTALKASDQWFKAAGFGGYSKREEAPTNVTAEDVVRQLLNVRAEPGSNVQVNVNVPATNSD